ncbi:MAG: YHS domain-containing protein [Candidatus Campbellbacteria bacterium]|nr:YHS domain-containing protein [Candidatus Campbellbacteria bacterium]
MNCCGNLNKSNSVENQVVCPIMGSPVDKAEAEKRGLVREYKGEKYYFCCNGCPEKFEKNPENYTKN